MTAAGWTWDEVKARHSVGSQVQGTIIDVPHYGVWADLGVGFPGLLLIPDAGLGRGQQTADHFRVGDPLTATVLWHNDERKQIRLIRRMQTA
jgi:ribosomal protein S1